MTKTNHLEGLDQLRALLTPDLYQHVDAGDRAALVGWGTLFSTVHYTDGMVRLHQAENCFAVGPIRRSAMEYAMTTVWLADAGDAAVDAMNLAHQDKQGKLLDGITAANAWDRFPAEAQAIAQANKDTQLPKASESVYLRMTHQLDRYDVNLDVDGKIPLRLWYTAESQMAHPSMIGAQMFFKDGEPVELHMMPRHGEVVPCLHIALILLYTAMLAYNQLLTGSPWTDDLLAVARTYDLDEVLPARQSGN
ncbi:hypothetical protein ABH926_008574 [Catenulispora sp. GP43]|uniref:hypothetical protein n=1 Tax=Catenulispora sp. GP43 TaxID=3156263 RepID=UPI003518F1E3